MSGFEFGDYSLELNVAGERFTVNCVAELADTMQAHQVNLVGLVEQLSGGTKTSADAIALCAEIIDDMLGAAAFERIFADREPTLTDCSDVLRFVIGEITEKVRQTQNRD